MGKSVQTTSSSRPGWEHFHHVADIGVRGFGPSKEDAFAQAALAMTAVITDPEKIEAKERVAIRCEAPDDELLLTDWLNALLYEMATRRLLFGRYAVEIHGALLRGEAWGEKVDVRKHAPAVEVKGATFTALEVRQRPDGLWLAQCVVDV